MFTLLKAKVHNPIFSITPFTLLDYPDKTACILWFAGCNMKCLYCYNPDIVSGKGKISFPEVLSFLKTRKGLLDGVVLSGGECTIHHGIKEFAGDIKSLGMQIKVDTNGSHPEKLKKLIQYDLVNYVALDFKSPAEKYQEITASHLYRKFDECLSILLESEIPFEIRTTYHSDLLEPKDIDEMAGLLYKRNYRGKYFIQNFVNNTPTIANLGYSKALRLQDIAASELDIVIRN